MKATDYQELAARTLLAAPPREYSANEIMLVWNGIGLGGESGEVLEVLKKGIFHDHGIDVEKLKKELGDVLWYSAAIATRAGLDLGDIMQANVDKLRERYPDGFTSGDSVARVDVEKIGESMGLSENIIVMAEP